MKITRFSARGLNGSINPDLTFDNNLNFLVGINGCGKTTSLRALTSLLTPDLTWLATADFERLEVEFELGEGKGSVIAERSSSALSLSLFMGGGLIANAEINLEDFSNLARARMDYAYHDEGQEIHLIEYVAQIGSRYDVVNKIREMPSPIYLGLDRTTLPALSMPRSAKVRPISGRRPRPTLRTFLDDSVAQAEELIFDAHNAAVRRRSAEAFRLREEILLSIFVQGQELADYKNPLPRKEDIKRYENYRSATKSAYKLAGMDEQKVASNVDQFFDTLIDLGGRLSKFKELEQAVQGTEGLENYIQWNELRRKLSTISHIEKKVTAYNKAEATIFSKIENYKTILNRFLYDSGKKIDVDDSGHPKIDFKGRGPVNTFHLSSGERQLFVLITNLMFNRDGKQASVLIIDEPELSLHLKWQEMFVDSMLEANPEAQLILATHSPSIILDHEEFCISMDEQ